MERDTCRGGALACLGMMRCLPGRKGEAASSTAPLPPPAAARDERPKAATAAAEVDLSAVRADIRRLLPDRSHDDGSLGPLMIRFAWHSSGTYDAASCTGGSDGGTIWLPAEAGDPENAGFDKARRLVTKLHSMHPTLTKADLAIIAGCEAIEASGGPRILCSTGRRDFSAEEAKAANPKSASGCPFGDGVHSPHGSRLPAARRRLRATSHWAARLSWPFASRRVSRACTLRRC